MGSGKSTLGKQLAAQAFFSDAEWVDLDALIVEQQQKSIPQIFAEHGEAAFRLLERDGLARLLMEDKSFIIATGGGAILSAENRALMQQKSTVIWLDATVDVLAGRIAGDGNRPLLDAVDPLLKMQTLSKQRNPLYAGVADLCVDTGLLETQEAVAFILAFMAE